MFEERVFASELLIELRLVVLFAFIIRVDEHRVGDEVWLLLLSSKEDERDETRTTKAADTTPTSNANGSPDGANLVRELIDNKVRTVRSCVTNDIGRVLILFGHRSERIRSNATREHTLCSNGDEINRINNEDSHRCPLEPHVEYLLCTRNVRVGVEQRELSIVVQVDGCDIQQVVSSNTLKPSTRADGGTVSTRCDRTTVTCVTIGDSRMRACAIRVARVQRAEITVIAGDLLIGALASNADWDSARVVVIGARNSATSQVSQETPEIRRHNGWSSALLVRYATRAHARGCTNRC